MIYISAISLVEGKVPGARRGIFLQRVFCVPFLSSFYSLFWGTRNNTNKQAVCGIPSMATQFSNEDSFPFDTRIVGCSLIAVSTVLCFTFWSRSWVSRNSNRGVRKWDETLMDLRDTEIGIKIMNRALGRSKIYLPNFNVRKVNVMKHQVGGHPMLSYESEYVMKPLNSDCRGFREVLFYEILQELDDCKKCAWSKTISAGKNCECNSLLVNYKPIAVHSSLLRALKPFCPNYFGTIVERCSDGSTCSSRYKHDTVPTHIVLSDVTMHLKKPCVLDLKIGQRTYEPDASLEKQESQHNKYPEQQIHGFRIVGMNVYDPNHSKSDALGYRRFGKKFGMQLKQKKDIRDAFCMFFKLNNATHIARYKVVENVMMDLIQLLQIHGELNRGMAFYASSLLIVVEGDDACFSPEKYAVKMIDFSHVRFNSLGDSGYIYGLESVIDILNDMREM